MRLSDLASANKVLSQSELVLDRELVKEIQSHLARLGFYPSHEIDGIWGPKTENALAQFCELVHLNNHKTGLYGPTFARSLLEARSLVPRTKSEHIQLIRALCQKQGIIDIRQIAYILATTYHETAHTYRPIDEIGSNSYFMRYEGRKDLGNSKPGDGARFKGRGYVQITGRRNYSIYSNLMGIDLVAQPEKVKEPRIAAFILVHGFKTGAFTGRKISDYINSVRCDFVQARRVINGMDRAHLIAGYAQKWLACLEKGTLWL